MFNPNYKKEETILAAPGAMPPVDVIDGVVVDGLDPVVYGDESALINLPVGEDYAELADENIFSKEEISLQPSLDEDGDFDPNQPMHQLIQQQPPTKYPGEMRDSLDLEMQAFDFSDEDTKDTSTQPLSAANDAMPTDFLTEFDALANDARTAQINMQAAEFSENVTKPSSNLFGTVKGAVISILTTDLLDMPKLALQVAKDISNQLIAWTEPDTVKAAERASKVDSATFDDMTNLITDGMASLMTKASSLFSSKSANETTVEEITIELNDNSPSCN